MADIASADELLQHAHAVEIARENPAGKTAVGRIDIVFFAKVIELDINPQGQQLLDIGMVQFDITGR